MPNPGKFSLKHIYSDLFGIEITRITTDTLLDSEINSNGFHVHSKYSAGAVWYIWQKSGPQGFFTRMQPQKNTARFFDYLTEISQRILQNYRSKTMFFGHFYQNSNPNFD